MTSLLSERIERFGSDERDADLVESAIDLFTLLSFTLIVAISTLGSAGGVTTKTERAVMSFGPLDRSNAVQSIPRNVVAILADGSATGASVALTTGDGGRPEVIWTSVSGVPLHDQLDARLDSIKRAEHVGLAVRNAKEPDAFYRLQAFYEIQVWLGKHEISAAVFLQGD